MLGLKHIWKKNCTIVEARFLLLACFGRTPRFDAEVETYTRSSFFGGLKRVIASPHFQRTVIDPATLGKRPFTISFLPHEQQLIAKILKSQFQEIGRTPETWLRLMRLLLNNTRFQKAFLSRFDAESLRYLNQFYAQRKADDSLELRAEVHQISPRMISIHIAAKAALPDNLSLYINGEYGETIAVPDAGPNVDFDHRFKIPTALNEAEEGTLSLFAEPSGQLLCPSIRVTLSVAQPHQLMPRISEELDAQPGALPDIRDSIPSLQQYASLRLEDYCRYADFFRPGKPKLSSPLPSLLLVADGDAGEAHRLNTSLAPTMKHIATVMTRKDLAKTDNPYDGFDFVVPIPKGATLDAYFAHWLASDKEQQALESPITRFGYDHMSASGKRCNPLFPCRFDPFRAVSGDPQSTGYAIEANSLSGWLTEKPELDIFSVDVFSIARSSATMTASKDYIPHILMTLPETRENQAKRKGLRSALPGPPTETAPETIGVIIPTKNQLELIKPCVESLTKTANVPAKLNIIIVDNGSSDPALLSWLDAQTAPVTVVKSDGSFNWSSLNNFGAAQSTTDILLFLNDDTAAITEGWDDYLRRLLALSDVGVVGAKLLYPDDTIQHGGIILTDDLHVVHEGKTLPADAPGYANRLASPRICDAVTGAFLACRKDDFDTIGGFDENFAVTFNDIDFCAKLDKLGRNTVYSPDIHFYHYESKSRGFDDDSAEKMARKREEQRLFMDKWGQYYHEQWEAHGRTYPDVFDMETAQDFTQLGPPHRL